MGDFWNYVDSKGQWLNLTVEAREQRAGYDTYLVRSHQVPADFRPFDLWIWLDAATLGTVEWGPPDASATDGPRNHPPAMQVFPLENRTYISHPNDDAREPQELQQRVLGWQQVEAPAGRFLAVETETLNSMGWTVMHGWYEPGVGNFVRQGDHRLVEWQRSPQPA